MFFFLFFKKKNTLKKIFGFFGTKTKTTKLKILDFIFLVREDFLLLIWQARPVE